MAIAPDQTALKVCIVDGDPAVRDSLATMLALSGHDVAAFATGEEFLTAAAAGREEGPIDCVICASELPDTTGLALFQAYRPENPHARFALLISRNNHALMAAARGCGVDAVFRKPLLSQPLRAFVRRS